MFKILVVGYLSIDSGKTTLAASLITALRREGLNSVGFKPIGATEIWFKPWVLEESKRRKVLVTFDGLLLEKASRGNPPAHVINPVGGLLTPVDPSKLEWREGFVDLFLNQPYRRISLLRITNCTPQGITNTHIINEDILQRTTDGISESILALIPTLNPPPVLSALKDIELFMEKDAATIADTCLEKLEDREVIVIESNSDIAAPTYRSVESKLVIVVAPSKAAIIDGERYARAVELKSISGKPWSVKVKEILALTKARTTIELPPKTEPMEGYSLEELETIIEEIKNKIKS